ncbi:CCHC-type domain-containing protein [Abeliophyllum distichum]|uniref:CCHC-type domain-containing protein n=1 Tax=Abeliophyllum distichum TaxID=126358 RepID=A0ABD1UT09_9LAMI
MNIEELIVRLRIEKDNKGSEKKMFNYVVVKANVVEYDPSSKENKNKFGKVPKLGPKGGVSKKKFLGKCYNCDRSLECRLSKRNNKKEANVVDDITHDVSEMNLATIISEVNLVGSNPRE